MFLIEKHFQPVDLFVLCVFVGRAVKDMSFPPLEIWFIWVVSLILAN